MSCVEMTPSDVVLVDEARKGNPRMIVVEKSGLAWHIDSQGPGRVSGGPGVTWPVCEMTQQCFVWSKRGKR